MLSYRTILNKELQIKFPLRDNQDENEMDEKKITTVLFQDVTYPVIRGHVLFTRTIDDKEQKRYISVIDNNVQRDLERSRNAVSAVIPIVEFDGAFKHMGVMILYHPHVRIAGHSKVHKSTFEYDRRGIDMPSEMTRIRGRY